MKIWVSNENMSVSNENMGVSNENMGVSNENMGVSNENMGVSNENMGVSNENMGVSNENKRISDEIANVPGVSDSSPVQWWWFLSKLSLCKMFVKFFFLFEVLKINCAQDIYITIIEPFQIII